VTEGPRSRPLRIGVVTTSYPRRSGDPAGGFVGEHVRALRALGHEVDVIAAGDHAAPAAREPGVIRVPGALFCYRSQYASQSEGAGLFPEQEDVAERLRAVARQNGLLIHARYGEPFIVKEMLRVDDIARMGVPSI
jgi:hypothetical protein